MLAGKISNVADIRPSIIQRVPNVILNPYRFAPASGIPTSGLIHHWVCDGESGDSTAPDTVGSIDLTCKAASSTVTESWVYDAELGRQVYDNPVNGGLSIPAGFGFSAETRTIVFHLKSNTTDAATPYILDNSGDTRMIFGISTASGTRGYHFYNASAGGWQSSLDSSVSSGIPSAQFTQVVFEYDYSLGSTGCWEDGVAGTRVSYSTSSFEGSSIWFFRRYGISGGEYYEFNGRSADILAYNRTLSSADRSAISSAVIG